MIIGATQRTHLRDRNQVTKSMKSKHCREQLKSSNGEWIDIQRGVNIQVSTTP